MYRAERKQRHAALEDAGHTFLTLACRYCHMSVSPRSPGHRETTNRQIVGCRWKFVSIIPRVNTLVYFRDKKTITVTAVRDNKYTRRVRKSTPRRPSSPSSSDYFVFGERRLVLPGACDRRDLSCAYIYISI